MRIFRLLYSVLEFVYKTIMVDFYRLYVEPYQPKRVGDYSGKYFPHFFQFETVYCSLTGEFYTIIDYLEHEGTYSVMETWRYDRGHLVCHWKGYPDIFEKLLD